MWAEEQSWFGLEDLVLEQEEIQESIKIKFLQYQLWTTANGVSIHISHMSTSHLRNCINKCKRENWRLYALPILIQEFNSRF
jgi:hypothetical protein